MGGGGVVNGLDQLVKETTIYWSTRSKMGRCHLGSEK